VIERFSQNFMKNVKKDLFLYRLSLQKICQCRDQQPESLLKQLSTPVTSAARRALV
jgi:hypothetical protein